MIVEKSVVEEGRGNTNFADLVFRGTSRLYLLLAFFAARAHFVCLAACVRCIRAGLDCKIKSCCCCTLPAVVSHLPECDAECLQHLPLHSITSGTAASRIHTLCDTLRQLGIHSSLPCRSKKKKRPNGKVGPYLC